MFKKNRILEMLEQNQAKTPAADVRFSCLRSILDERRNRFWSRHGDRVDFREEIDTNMALLGSASWRDLAERQSAICHQG